MLYFADADEKIYSVQFELSLKTGTDIRKALEEAMKKEPPKTSHLPLISANTKLNSLILEKDNTVHADFSNEFVSEMNAGAGYETLILQSVTNTIGNYFGTNKVLITLDGKPYESGHILMDEEEVFEVNMDQVVQ
jgi:spore germination protein GerM